MNAKRPVKRKVPNWLIASAIGAAIVAIFLLVRVVSHQQESPRNRGGSQRATMLGAEVLSNDLQPTSVNTQRRALALMGPSTAEKAKLSLAYLSKHDLSDGRKFVSFDIASAQTMQLGDAFSVDIPGVSDSSIAIVDNIDELEGIRRLTGSVLDAESSESRFSLTVSDDGSYVAGHFAMGEQEYILEARNGAGWLMESSQMSERLIQSEQSELD